MSGRSIGGLLEWLAKSDLVAFEVEHFEIAKAPGATHRLALDFRAFSAQLRVERIGVALDDPAPMIFP